MATWNKSNNKSWKSFYQKKKPELQTKYPFLKDYQIREKVKKLWTMKKKDCAKDADYKPLTIMSETNKENNTGSVISHHHVSKQSTSSIDGNMEEKEINRTDKITSCAFEYLLHDEEYVEKSIVELEVKKCDGNSCHGDDYKGSKRVMQDENVNSMKLPLVEESIAELFQPISSGTNNYKLNTIGNMPTAKRRVFRSSTSQTTSNFHTLFTDDDQIFL